MFRIPRASILRLLPRIGIIQRTPILPLRSSPLTSTPKSFFPRFPTRLYASSAQNGPHPEGDTPKLDQTLTAKLKHLIKSYGWYALGVYVVLSTLDFAVAFAGIHLLGADYVGKITSSVKDYVMGWWNAGKPVEPGQEGIDAAGSGREGLYATLVLAYTVHKTLFLPVRVGLTAALTPRLVGWLRTRGWAGREGAMRAGNEMRERLRSRSQSKEPPSPS